MAVRWPSRVGATLTIRKQSSREAVLLPRHLRHQGLRHRRRFLVSQVKTRNFFEKTEFPCSSTSILIWWLSSKPGHTSTTAAKPRRLPKTESTCSFKSALIFALSDVSRRLPALGRPLDLQVGVLGFTGPVPFPHPPPPQQFRKTHLCMRRRRY